MVHTHTIGTRALLKTHPEGIACKQCLGLGASHPERVVLGKLSGMGAVFQTQVKVLREKYGAVDFVLFPHKLIIQVDGPHHMEEGSWGEALAHQMDVDRRFNEEALAQGMRVLRLHHRDVSLGKSVDLIKRAVSFCTLDPSTPRLWFSPSYPSTNYKDV